MCMRMRPLSLMLWVYFLLSQVHATGCMCHVHVHQVVLLNLLVAIMGDTWQRVKESADEEWKFLLVQVRARLHGCMVAWLHGCMVAWLHACLCACACACAWPPLRGRR